jgi:hypothetical protein
VENLDRIIMVVKNWLDYPCMNYKTNANLKDYIIFEVVIGEENYGFMENLNILKS